MLFFDGATDVAQMLPKRVRRIVYSLFQVIWKSELLPQSFTGFEPVCLFSFCLPDGVRGLEQLFDRFGGDKNAAIVIGHHRARGRRSESRSVCFAKTRDILVERLKQKADHPRTLAVLAQVDAGLGKKEEALREAKRAVELMPTTRDAYDAPLVLQGLAQVYAWTGEKDLAIKTLEQILTVPGYLTYGYLHVDPAWDPLRGDRRFEALVASLGPSKI